MTKPQNVGDLCYCGHGMFEHYMCGAPSEMRCLRGCGCQSFQSKAFGGERKEYRGVYRHDPAKAPKPKPPSNQCVICDAPIDPKTRRYSPPSSGEAL